jgi:protein ImuB
MGNVEEIIDPVVTLSVFHERLHCLEPIVTATGIEIALQNLLDILCAQLQHEQKGLRSAVFKGYRVDGKIIQMSIGTLRPSCNSQHLFKLFHNKIDSLEPAMGIELFTLEAPLVEDLQSVQEQLWQHNNGLENAALYELLDRISGKLHGCEIRRYIPDAHYWPERSYKAAPSLHENVLTTWRSGRPRPLQLLHKPEPIEVTAPVPDYPPMLFRYKGRLHKIARADGPERIEQEWWLQEGQHRDYYYVEDEEGYRYWLFRSGHYDVERTYQWYLHGFFA